MRLPSRVPYGIVMDMTKTPPAALRDQIVAELARQHITKKELALRVGVPYGTLLGRLSSAQGLRVEDAYQISEALGVRLSKLQALAEEASSSTKDAA